MLEPLMQAVPHPGAQLSCRLLRKRDHHHLLDAGGAVAEDLHHPIHENARLAGAGARLQEEAGVQVGGGGGADFLVDRLFGHGMAAAGSVSRHGCRRGLRGWRGHGRGLRRVGVACRAPAIR